MPKRRHRGFPVGGDLAARMLALQMRRSLPRPRRDALNCNVAANQIIDFRWIWHASSPVAPEVGHRHEGHYQEVPQPDHLEVVDLPQKSDPV